MESFEKNPTNREEQTRFNLEKPEGYGENKKRGISLEQGAVSSEDDFGNLGRTGDIVVDADGRERVVKTVTYTISETIELNVRGRSYTYRDTTNALNTISLEYNKEKRSVDKMHCNSENPVFAGRAIMDLIERIPVGAEILGEEVSMSSDSFPLLINTIAKYSNKDPEKFLLLQVGEFYLNSDGKYSAISRAVSAQEKVSLLNETIDSFIEKTKIPITPARIEVVDGEEKIVIPKIKAVKRL